MDKTLYEEELHVRIFVSSNYEDREKEPFSRFRRVCSQVAERMNMIQLLSRRVSHEKMKSEADVNKNTNR